MTTKGAYCAPRKEGFNAGSCYSIEQLYHIIDRYNRGKSGRDRITPGNNATQETLWTLIDRKMQKKCSTEMCWMDEYNLIADDEETFMPLAPEGGPKGWLSTDDIKKVLKQRMRVYPNFLALGPVAIDFCSETGNEVCNLDLNAARKQGKNQIGIVFNTDPSTKGGQHWICMYIDISPANRQEWTINYFDSYGMAQLPPEIHKLVQKYQAQNNGQFKVEMNCSDVSGICTRSVRQQRLNTECGMYCIIFITERLKGKTWDYLLTHGENDEEVNKKRPLFFRPRI